MKHHGLFSLGLAALLAALLAVGGAAAQTPQTFSLGEGITWHTGPEDLTALLGDPDGILGESAQKGLYSVFYDGVTVSAYQARMIVYFLDGVPALIVYDLPDTPDGERRAYLAQALTARYGEAVEEGQEAFQALLGRLPGLGLEALPLSEYRQWTLADGTRVALLNRKGSTQINYVNELYVQNWQETYVMDGL